MLFGPQMEAVEQTVGGDETECGSIPDMEMTNMGQQSTSSKLDDIQETGKPPNRQVQDARIVCCEVRYKMFSRF